MNFTVTILIGVTLINVCVRAYRWIYRRGFRQGVREGGAHVQSIYEKASRQ